MSTEVASQLALLPAYNPVPGLRLWMEPLNWLLFWAHMLLINTVLGGSLIAFSRKLRRGGQAHYPAEASFNQSLPKGMALAVNLGVANLLFAQVLRGHFVYPAYISMAWWWLAMPFLALCAYYGLYISKGQSRSRATGTIASLLTIALLLLVALLLTSANVRIGNPATWSSYLENQGGVALLPDDSTLWPRYLHNLFASLAVGGLVLALYGTGKKNTAPTEAMELKDEGLRWFLYATFGQILVGVWYLFSLPEEILAQFKGSDSPLLHLLLAGVLLGLGALFAAYKRRLSATLFLALLGIGAMVVLRHYVRVAMHSPFAVPDAHIRQTSGLMLFAASLLTVFLICLLLVRGVSRELKERGN